MTKKSNKQIYREWIFFLSLILPLSFSYTVRAVQNKEYEKYRGYLLEQIKRVEEEFKANPENGEPRFKLAHLLFQAGDFWEAKELLQPLFKRPRPSVEAAFLMARLEYLTGNYERAEEILERIRTGFSKGDKILKNAETLLLFVYYQTNQFHKGETIFKEGRIELPLLELMRSFKEEVPYQIKWKGEKKVAEASFLVTDPIPVISMEVEGEKIYALIDTGADCFILDTEKAEELGIEEISKVEGTFGGGKKAELGFSRVNSIKIGEVSLNCVPISLLPTRRFSRVFAEGRYIIEGILGVGVLKQFLSTIDYLKGKLVLREKSAEGKKVFLKEIEGKPFTEVPFILAQTHMLLARGRLNEREDLTFYVDSGLVSEAAFSAPIQTLNYVGIPIPETRVQEDSVGGGGSKWASGIFPIKILGLGELKQTELLGEYGSRTPDTYWGLGFIQDGMISHRFLRRYSWTLDFSEMKFIFTE